MNKGPIEACETWLKRPQSFLPRLLALDLLAIAIVAPVPGPHRGESAANSSAR